MKILLVANYTKTLAYQAMQVAAHWLSERGQTVRQVTSDQLLLGCPLREKLCAAMNEYDFVVSFGGDGTILRTAGIVGTTEVPLLGINYGELGFLAGASSEASFAALEAILANEIVAERRFLLKYTINYASGYQIIQTALNEIVLGRSDPGRDISLGVTLNGHALPDVRGDGIIVATASGSTAYALSAGGPVMMPTARGLLFVPIMPHNLSLRPIITGSTDCIQLTYRSRFAQTIVLTADGQQLSSPEKDDFVTQVAIVPASEHLVLLRYDAPDFYTHVAQSFFGGAPC